MTNSRPSRPRPSKPSYGSSTPSSTDADKRMGDAEERMSNVGNQLTTGNKISKLATDKFFHGETFKSGNTRVVRHGDAETSLILYNTAIATKDKYGIITLNSGGYRTATTKERLNSVLSPIGVKISQKQGVWEIQGSDGVRALFVDNMRVNGQGKLGLASFNRVEQTQSQHYKAEHERARREGKIVTNRAYEGQYDN